MKRLLFSLVALVLAAIPANAQTVPGQFPANTVYCNPTGGGALAVPCTLPQLATILASGNNNAPQINLFRAQNADVTAAAGIFAAQLRVIAAQSFGAPGGGNAIFGAAIQDTNNASGMNTSFPAGVTGYGVVNANGTSNYAYGLFGRCDLLLVVGSCQGAEVDCNQANDAPNTFPPSLGAPVTHWECNGIQSVNIGPGKAHIAYRAVSGPGGGAWLAAFYADPPPTGNIYGLFIDAGSTGLTSPQYSALLRNSGQGAGIHLLMQTIGSPVLTNPIIQHQNSSGIATFTAYQSGQVVVNSNAAAQSPRNTGTLYTGVAIDGTPSAMELDTYTNTTGAQVISPALLFRSANGSGATPTALAAGSVMGVIAATPYVTGGFLGFSNSRIIFNYTDPTPADAGGEIEFDVTPNGSTVVGSRIVAGKFLNNGTLNLPQTVTGTPAASLCIDASNNIIKKTTTGPCV